MAAKAGQAGQARSKDREGSTAPSRLVPAALAELLGTFIFVFFGTAAIMQLGQATSAFQIPPETAPTFVTLVGSAAIGIAFGFGIAAAVYAFGHISGAHLNPAVTLGLAATGRFPASAVPAYIVAQLAGAVLAALTVAALFPPNEALVLGASLPAAGNGIALLAEAVITFILLVVVLATTRGERESTTSAALPIGLTVAAGVTALLSISGGSFNPARSLGPMLVALDFPGWWVYLVGPIGGGILGALFYEFVLKRGSPPEGPEPR